MSIAAVVVRCVIDSLAHGAARVVGQLGGAERIELFGGLARWRPLARPTRRAERHAGGYRADRGDRRRQRTDPGRRPRRVRRPGRRAPPPGGADHHERRRGRTTAPHPNVHRSVRQGPGGGPRGRARRQRDDHPARPRPARRGRAGPAHPGWRAGRRTATVLRPVRQAPAGEGPHRREVGGPGGRRWRHRGRRLDHPPAPRRSHRRSARAHRGHQRTRHLPGAAGAPGGHRPADGWAARPPDREPGRTAGQPGGAGAPDPPAVRVGRRGRPRARDPRRPPWRRRT